MTNGEFTAPPDLTAIEQRRRTQFINTTIDTLAERGYAGASFSQIASRAGVSKGLASYHFKNKDDLMFQTITYIMKGWHTYIQKEIDAQATMHDAFVTYIEANVAYMSDYPSYFPAIVEIFFNARDSNGKLLYKISDDDPNIAMLEHILIAGQKNGEFDTSFNPRMVAISVRASIDQVLGQMMAWPKFNLSLYTKEIAALYTRAIKKTS